jgi:hypothetical protein
MEATATTPTPVVPTVLTEAQATELRAELARLKWGLESHGGASRLNERMKIQNVQRQLRNAGLSEA